MSEEAYLNLIKKTVIEGEQRQTRNAITRSLFGEKLEFNLKDGFPLLTTKKVFWRGVVEELLWFLRGETDANILKAKGVHIWDGNTTEKFLKDNNLNYEQGVCGPIYGFQWRFWNCEYNKDPTKIIKRKNSDQLRNVLEQLENDPTSRRMIINAWNVEQLDQMCLPPCHTIYQFYKGRNGLSCQLLARSQDLILGTPFNIASTALLTTLIAHLFGLETDRVIICMGDAHVYEQHVQNAMIQVNRKPMIYPKIKINKPVDICASIDDKLNWLETLQFDDIIIDSYNCHPPIKFEMVA